MSFYLKDIKSPRRVLEHKKVPTRGFRKLPKNNKTQLFQIKTTEHANAVKIYLADTNLCLIWKDGISRTGNYVNLEKERETKKGYPKNYNSYWILENRQFVEESQKESNDTENTQNHQSSSTSSSNVSSVSSSSNSRTKKSKSQRDQDKDPSLAYHYIIKSYKTPDHVLDLSTIRLTCQKFNPSLHTQFFLLQNANDSGPLEDDPINDKEADNDMIEGLIQQCQELNLSSGRSSEMDTFYALLQQLTDEGMSLERLRETRRMLSSAVSGNSFGLGLGGAITSSSSNRRFFRSYGDDYLRYDESEEETESSEDDEDDDDDEEDEDDDDENNDEEEDDEEYDYGFYYGRPYRSYANDYL